MGLGAAGSGAGSLPSWGRLAAEGCTSTGATMSVVAHRSASVSSGSCRCSCGGGHHRHYCVNIYVNSNVQGVTNSVLVGSKVVMRVPGPRVSSRHEQPRRDGGRRRHEGKRSCRQQHRAKATKVAGIAVAVVSLLFVAAAAAAVLYLYLYVRVRR